MSETMKGAVSSREAEQERLETRLWAAFEADPLEDGMYHPAEEVIGEALQAADRESTLKWFKEFSMDGAHPGFAASILRCLGRQEHPGTDKWRAELVRDGLASEDVEIRDAAVQAAESWEDRSLRGILEVHDEPVPWLRDYIRDVIDDLKE